MSKLKSAEELKIAPTDATLYDVNKRNKLNFYKISDSRLLLFNRGTGKYEPAIGKHLSDLHFIYPPGIKKSLRDFIFDDKGEDELYDQKYGIPLVEEELETPKQSLEETAEVVVTEVIYSPVQKDSLLVTIEKLFNKYTVPGLPIKPINNQSNYTLCYRLFYGWSVYEVPIGTYVPWPCSISKDVVERVIKELQTLGFSKEDIFGQI